ncbi:MAG TPA: hypothetical protein VFV73_36175 [Streptosporangiaceae bacterium]|nr:hypothetical protein [Streptosporangiaceae bacterium]
MAATEHPRPGLMTRLAAAMRGEIAATTVEAYRRVGAAAPRRRWPTSSRPRPRAPRRTPRRG